jgi:hypothetical protein
MKDTIGAHLLTCMQYRALAHFQGGAGYPLLEADYLGQAYGHAFRAAELAYDLGQRHGEAVVWGEGSIQWIRIMGREGS